jgi:hypothetical protein
MTDYGFPFTSGAYPMAGSSLGMPGALMAGADSALIVEPTLSQRYTAWAFPSSQARLFGLGLGAALVASYVAQGKGQRQKAMSAAGVLFVGWLVAKSRA